MANVTPRERLLLENVARNLFTAVNGAEPETLGNIGSVWSDQIGFSGPNKLSGRSISGLTGTLVKKGLLGSDGECVWLTEAGFAAYKASQ